VDLTWVYLSIVLAGLLIYCHFYRFALRYAERIAAALKQLTRATRQLGEGRYEGVEVPSRLEKVPEMQELSQALEETAQSNRRTDFRTFKRACHAFYRAEPNDGWRLDCRFRRARAASERRRRTSV